MTSTVVYAVCAVLILTVIKDMKPTYALLGGVMVAAVMFVGAVSLFGEFTKELTDMLDDGVHEYLRFMLRVTGVSVCADIGSDICVQMGYASVGKGIVLYGRVSVLILAMPLVKELLNGVQALF